MIPTTPPLTLAQATDKLAALLGIIEQDNLVSFTLTEPLCQMFRRALPVILAERAAHAAELEEANGTKLTKTRLWDLVRYQRSELLNADLITREEYAALLTDETKDAPGQGSPSPRRLESYDEVRARLTAAEAECATLREDNVNLTRGQANLIRALDASEAELESLRQQVEAVRTWLGNVLTGIAFKLDAESERTRQLIADLLARLPTGAPTPEAK